MVIDFILIVNTLMALSAVAMGLLVYTRKPRESYSIWFVMIAIAGAGWLITNSMANSATSLLWADLSSKLAYLFGYYAMLLSVLFSYRYPVKRKFGAMRIILFSLLAILGAIFSMARPVTGYAYYLYGDEGISFSTSQGLVWYMGLFIFTIVYLFWVLRDNYKLLREHRDNIVLIAVAFGSGGALGLIVGVIVPVILGEWATTLFSSLPILVAISLITYAVIRHRLFDIRLATARSLAYAMTLTVLSLSYYAVAYIISASILQNNVDSNTLSTNPLNILLALVLAFIFQPIRQLFDRLTNKIFYRGEYDKDVFFREFGQILSFDTNLRALLEQAGSYISDKLKAEKVTFQITGRGVFGANGRKSASFLDTKGLEKFYLSNYQPTEPIVRDYLQQDEIREVMDEAGVKIILPLVLKKKVLGCMFLSDHKSSGYSARDVGVIGSIANELTIAVSNSLSVEEIRDLNSSLQHRVDEATLELKKTNSQLRHLDETKDEFISMASHQLRTPLTSIKGYLDMVLQGDLGRVNPTQRAALSDAYLSSERMVALINDFLNISRLQTGKFIIDRRDSDVKLVLHQELQMLSVMAKQHGLKLELDVDKDLPHLLLDIDKLKQVIVNMIDNAIYYSTPNTTINIRLGIENDELVFSVRDTGIGVPKAEQDKLFGKFFRATNARKRRPDGTGVGLFLSKKVVLAHGGQMIFESTEGVGSLFGFRIPVES